MNTRDKINRIVKAYYTLVERVELFINNYDDGSKRSPLNIKIDSSGSTITYEKNTACSCHPEYDYFEIPVSKFIEWEKQQSKEIKL